jgi:hypothetical protein
MLKHRSIISQDQLALAENTGMAKYAGLTSNGNTNGDLLEWWSMVA